MKLKSNRKRSKSRLTGIWIWKMEILILSELLSLLFLFITYKPNETFETQAQELKYHSAVT